MVYREIRFDILNVKCNDIGGIAAWRFLFCVQQDIRHTSAAGPKYVLHKMCIRDRKNASEKNASEKNAPGKNTSEKIPK